MADNLTAAKVRTMRAPGRYLDGNGLSLHVITPERRRWVFRYMRQGRERQLTLGDADLVGLGDARRRHTEARALLAKGIDPLDVKHADQPKPEGHRFEAVAERYVQAHEAAWRNPKHRQQWRNTLATYAYPVLGAKLVHEITVNDILAVLTPLWNKTPETASRLRGRIESIMGYAKARGWRAGENPATWRNNLALLLPRKSKVRPVRHHAALDWLEAPAFMRALDADGGMGARALRFAIVTAARSGEVRHARWDEMDLEAATWTVPAHRMKGNRMHRVPLSEPALAILHGLAALRQGSLVFPGRDGETPLSDTTLGAVLKRMQRHDLTPHGFRSTFSTWAADHGVDPALVESALAHVQGDKVAAAYQRSDRFEQRRGDAAVGGVPDWGAGGGGVDPGGRTTVRSARGGARREVSF
jgi:integrase